MKYPLRQGFFHVFVESIARLCFLFVVLNRYPKPLDTMSKIIFTADDYGVIPGVDRGIIDAVNAGLINSVAAFGNHINSRERTKILEYNTPGKQVEIGCHLTLTSGEPLTKGVKWMLRNDGFFRTYTQHERPGKAATMNIDQRAAVKGELKAQIESLLRDGGVLKHLSSHHNTLSWFQDYWEITMELAKEYSIPTRNPILRPIGDKNRYNNIVRLLSLDNLSKDQRAAMKQFQKDLHTYIVSLPANAKPAMAVATDARAYGKVFSNLISSQKMGVEAGKTAQEVNDELISLKGRNETVEFIFHIIRDHYPALSEMKKSVQRKFSNYSGINDGYFTGRIIEHRVLKRVVIPAGISLSSWSNL